MNNSDYVFGLALPAKTMRLRGKSDRSLDAFTGAIRRTGRISPAAIVISAADFRVLASAGSDFQLRFFLVHCQRAVIVSEIVVCDPYVVVVPREPGFRILHIGKQNGHGFPVIGKSPAEIVLYEKSVAEVIMADCHRRVAFLQEKEPQLQSVFVSFACDVVFSHIEVDSADVVVAVGSVDIVIGKRDTANFRGVAVGLEGLGKVSLAQLSIADVVVQIGEVEARGGQDLRANGDRLLQRSQRVFVTAFALQDDAGGVEALRKVGVKCSQMLQTEPLSLFERDKGVVQPIFLAVVSAIRSRGRTRLR